MEQFDVIIVGGGPAGLECARELSASSLRVLLLEKQEGFGDKLCAGGLTLKDMEILPLPDHVIEQKILRTSIHSRRRSAGTLTKDPFIFTVNRRVLGTYQRGLLEETGVEVRTNSQVTEISDHQVVLKDGTALGFRYLVGADGYSSVVRRYLGMKMEKRLIGFQYTIPVKEEYPALEIHMDARRFSIWYAWIFPHKDTIAVGCCCDPRKMDPQKLKAGFHDWLKDKSIEPGNARLESYPIAYDYQGVRFGNIFLAGEAAGLASGLTGEGIYQSLASGQEVARLILDPEYETEQLGKVLKYNRAMEQVQTFFRRSGLFRGAVQELLLILMNTDWIRNKIRDQFSPYS
jgi:geranylgeranyl reductase